MKLWSLYLFFGSVALNTEYVAMEMRLVLYNKTFSGTYKYLLQEADITLYKTKVVVICYTLVSDFYVDM